jgi:hypothetical protein
MAADLRFLDGFQHYTTETGDWKWDVWGGSCQIIDQGRTGKGLGISGASANYRSGCVKLFQGNNGNLLNVTKACVGFAFKFRLAGPPTESPYLWFFRNNDAEHIAIRLNTDLTLSALRCDDAASHTWTVLATSEYPLREHQWHHIQIKVVLDPVAGSVEVKQDSISRLTFTGNTLGDAAGLTADNFEIGDHWPGVIPDGPGPFAVGYLYDDLWITAGDNADYLGDIRVGLIRPDAPGDLAEWVPSEGANWDAVNDLTPDEDATYNRTATSGARDLYFYEDVPAIYAIKGVQLSSACRKEDIGPRTVRNLLKTAGGTVYEGDAHPVQDEYAYTRTLWEANPETGNPFTPSEVNLAQFGLELL